MVRREKVLLVVLCGALFLDALDVSMSQVALPSIGTDLKMAPTGLQWVVSGYVLGFGGFLLLGGRVADLAGRRRVLLVSLTAFVFASAASSVAQDASVLVVTRLLKGVAAAFTAPAGLSLITTSFAEGQVRNRALTVYTATGASGFSLGLVIGGALTELSWRWTCAVPALVGLAILLVSRRAIPKDDTSTGPRLSFDIAGAVLITLASVLTVLTIVEIADAGWFSAQTLVTAVCASLSLAVFVVVERRAKPPLVRLGILRSGSLVRANLAAASLFGAWAGFLFVTTLYLQDLRGWSPLMTGLAVAPSGAVVVLLASYVGSAVTSWGTSPLIFAGLASSTLGYVLNQRISAGSPYLSGVLPTVLLGGLGFALAYGPLNIAATRGVPPHEQGLASGLVSSSFQLGGAFTLAAVSAVITLRRAEPSSGGRLVALHDGLWVCAATALAGLLVASWPLMRHTVSALRLPKEHP
jgi:MFS family permease